MNLHRIEVRVSGSDPYASRVYLDGEMISGVTRVEVVADVNNPELASVTIKMVANVTASIDEVTERRFATLPLENTEENA